MVKPDLLAQLFNHEATVLEHATRIAGNQQYRDDPLRPEYVKLVKEYQKLLKVTQKIFRISDTQSKYLKQRENEVKNLLDNSNQGFLTFGPDLLVNREYSAECVQIFNQKIASTCIVELLSGANRDQARLFAEVFTAIFQSGGVESALPLLTKLPGMIKVEHRYINVKYKLLETDGTDDFQLAVMLILTDITEKRKAEDRVFYLSFHDELTSLFNRAYVENIIPQLQFETEAPLSVIMADMNGLKLTNDVFGHESGDRLLVNAAKVFSSCCRRDDIVARWGGDEFLMILPGAGSAVCQKVCDRIRKACRAAAADPIELSVSLGSATIERMNTDLESLMNVAENMMYSNKLVESKAFRKKIILNMEKVLHAKCYEDIRHIYRVKSLTEKFAVALRIAPDTREWNDLMMLATMHDIGKVAIPREILGKTGPLTLDEWQIMQSHTEIGYRMAQSIEEPVLAQAILAVREHYDGKGYPYGLQGEEIPLMARIVAIVDTYDVMTHAQPYQKKRSRAEAIQEMERCAATQFDPELIRVFLDNIAAWDEPDAADSSEQGETR